MHPKHAQLKSRNIGVVVALAAAILLSLAGCAQVFGPSFDRVNALVSDFDPSSVGEVAQEGNYAEGVGDTLQHHVVVWKSADALPDVQGRLSELGYSPAGDPNDPDPSTTWHLRQDNVDYDARLVVLEPGDSILVSKGEPFNADAPTVAVDFTVVG